MAKLLAICAFVVIGALMGAALNVLAALDRQSSHRFFQKYSAHAQRALLRGDMETAFLYQQAACEQADRLDEHDIDRIRAESKLAQTYLNRGDIQEAERLFRSCVIRMQGNTATPQAKWLGAACKAGLASTLLAQNSKTSEPKTLLAEALAEQRAVLDTGDDADVAATVNSMTTLAHLTPSSDAVQIKGLYKEATSLAQSRPGLALLEQDVSSDYLHWLGSTMKRKSDARTRIEDLRTEARLHMRSGDSAKAQQALLQALSIAMHEPGDLKKEQALTLKEGADLALSQGRESDAHQMYDECAELVPNDLAFVDDVFRRRCKIYIMANDRKNPIITSLLRKQADLRLKLYGPHDVLYAATLCDLAESLRLHNSWAEAEALLNKGIPVIEKSASPADKANVYASMGMTKLALNKIPEGQLWCEKMIRECSQDRSVYDNRNLTRCLQTNMDWAFEGQRYDKALEYSRVWFVVSKELEFRDQDILKAAITKACSAVMEGQEKEAVQAFSEANQIITRVPEETKESDCTLVSRQIERARAADPAKADLLVKAYSALEKTAFPSN